LSTGVRGEIQSWLKGNQRDVDARVIAKRMISGADYPTRGEWLEELLVDAVDQSQRLRVHRVEQEAVAELFTRRSTTPVRAIATEQTFASLVRRAFALGDGRRIEWGAATIDEHRERIMYLMKQRYGLDKTIEAHQQAIRTIESAGVSCLDDLAAVREDEAIAVAS